MVAATRDPHKVARHDEHKLRQFLAARRAGDADRARRWWDEIVSDNFDRVHGMVFLQSRGHLSSHEQDEALQRALIKLTNNMIHTFNGTSMGEWVESTRTLVFGACVDTQRRAATTSKRESGLHQTDDDGAQTSRLDSAVYAAIEKERREREDDELQADDIAYGQRFLDWAVPQLSAKRRAVVELDREDVPVGKIQERLGVSRDVVYASRSRALRDLGKLRQDYRP